MRARAEHGYSLIELVIVVAVLTTIAALAVPVPSSVEHHKLDVAVSEVASALRFARSEASRTGQPHGVEQVAGTQRLRVFRLDTGAAPPTPVYDVIQPVSKQAYDVDLQSLSLGAVDSLALSANFRATCTQAERILFDANGTPWCTDPDNVLLDDWELALTLGMHNRVVRTDGITGRVSVQ